MSRFNILRITILLLAGWFCIGQAAAQTWEVDMLKGINPEHPNSFLWKGASGSTYPLAAAIPTGMLVYGIVKHDKPTRRKSYEMFGSVILSSVISEGMKGVFNRERPAQKYPGIIFPYKDAKDRSFPSGHTTLAFATATTLALEYKKWYVVVPAYVWATGVAYSRMYLGVHYPSDVLAGAAVGAGGALLSHWLCKKIFK